MAAWSRRDRRHLGHVRCMATADRIQTRLAANLAMYAQSRETARAPRAYTPAGHSPPGGPPCPSSVSRSGIAKRRRCRCGFTGTKEKAAHRMARVGRAPQAVSGADEGQDRHGSPNIGPSCVRPPRARTGRPTVGGVRDPADPALERGTSDRLASDSRVQAGALVDRAL